MYTEGICVVNKRHSLDLMSQYEISLHLSFYLIKLAGFLMAKDAVLMDMHTYCLSCVCEFPHSVIL